MVQGGRSKRWDSLRENSTRRTGKAFPPRRPPPSPRLFPPALPLQAPRAPPGACPSSSERTKSPTRKVVPSKRSRRNGTARSGNGTMRSRSGGSSRSELGGEEEGEGVRRRAVGRTEDASLSTPSWRRATAGEDLARLRGAAFDVLARRSRGPIRLVQSGVDPRRPSRASLLLPPRGLLDPSSLPPSPTRSSP